MLFLLSGATGHMGQMILETLGKSYPLNVLISKENPNYENYDPQTIKVVVDFSEASFAFPLLSYFLSHHVPCLSGTTKFTTAQLKDLYLIADKTKTKFIYKENFDDSLERFEELIPLMEKGAQKIIIVEKHHKSKLDSPSGTSLRLLRKFTNPQTISIISKRTDKTQFVHTIIFDYINTSITITHESKGRESFASGIKKTLEELLNEKKK